MNDWNDNIFYLLQTDVKERLENDAFFSDVKVLLKRDGVTEQEVEIATGPQSKKAGKTGACCIVIMPEIPDTEGEGPGPSFPIEISVQVVEAPATNDLASVGTGKKAERIAFNVLNLLHLYSPFHLGSTLVSRKRPIRPFEIGRSDWVSYLVSLEMRSSCDRTNKVANPNISVVGTTVSLTCATVGAFIYYTTDGSYPGAANAEAVLYAAPFEAAPGTMVRAVAYLANFIPSDSVAGDLA
jgi:hypothetical protein